MWRQSPSEIAGIISGAAPGLAYFDLSTTDPDTIHRIAAAAKPKGVHVLDAPVSGGVTGAEQATLCIMVGGDQSVYTSYKPVLGPYRGESPLLW